MAKTDLFLVDDDVVIRNLVPEYLNSSSINVICFKSAEETLEAILEEKYHPKLIITDYNLPGMNGIDLIRQSKEIGSLAPVILITAFSNRKIMTQAWNHGVFDFLEKPLNSDHLIEAVKKALAIGNASEDSSKLLKLKGYEKIRRQNSFISAERSDFESEDSLIDWEFANNLKKSLSEEKTQEIIVQLKLQTYDDLKILFEGISEQSWPKIKASSHRMAGMSANMGLFKACELCKNIENTKTPSSENFIRLAFELEKILLNSIEQLFTQWNMNLSRKTKAS